MPPEPEQSEILEDVLAEARRQLKANLSLLALLKGNTPLWAIAKLRDEWLTPPEKFIQRLV